MVWTHFWDMHSGGGQKLEWAHIFIEAPEAVARAVFWHRFKRNPDKVTCTCCGADYSVSEDEDIIAATAFERGCRSAHRAGTLGCGDGNFRYLEPGEPVPEGWELGNFPRGYSWALRKKIPDDGITLEHFKAESGALFISADEIKPDECRARIPAQGYVWVGDDE